MRSLTAFNLMGWIDQHRAELRPPVCNQQVFEEDDFIVMIVGGPNSRSDFHVDEGPELFLQIEGDMVLQVIDAGRRTAVGIPASLVRFTMLQSFDNIRPARLPKCLQDRNPTGAMWRQLDGQWTQADVAGT